MALFNIVTDYYFFLLLFTFVFLFFLLIRNTQKVKDSFKGVSRKAWVVLLIIILVSLCIKVAYVPVVNKVFNDEYAYKLVSLSFLKQNKLCENHQTLNYLEDECTRPVWAPAWPFMIYSTYFFSNDYMFPFYFNIFLGLITTLIFFLITYVLTKKESLAIVGSLFIAFLPTHLKFSSSMVSEISSLLFVSIIFLFLLLYLKKKDEELLFIAIVSSLILLQIKFENIIIVGAFVLFLLLKNRRFSFDKKTLFFVVLLLTIVTLIFNASNIHNFTKSERSSTDWITSGNERTSNLNHNLGGNIKFFFDNQKFLLGITIVILLGLYGSFRSDWKTSLVMTIIFVMLFIIYSSHGMGHFNISESDRYILSFALPLMIFFVYGVSLVAEKIGDKRTTNILILLLALYMIIFVFKNPNYYNYEVWEQTELKYIKQVELDEDCLIFQEQVSQALLSINRDFYPFVFYPKFMNNYDECHLLYDRRVLFMHDFKVDEAYSYVKLEPYKKAESIYPKGKNPFFVIHTS